MSRLNQAIRALKGKIFSDKRLSEVYPDEQAIIEEIITEWAKENFEEFGVQRVFTPEIYENPVYVEHSVKSDTLKLVDIMYEHCATKKHELVPLYIRGSLTVPSHSSSFFETFQPTIDSKDTRVTTRMWALLKEPRLTKK